MTSGPHRQQGVGQSKITNIKHAHFYFSHVSYILHRILVFKKISLEHRMPSICSVTWVLVIDEGFCRTMVNTCASQQCMRSVLQNVDCIEIFVFKKSASRLSLANIAGFLPEPWFPPLVRQSNKIDEIMPIGYVKKAFRYEINSHHA